jgi:ribosomal protein S18 acetylase RimI-like enzyme
VAAELEVRGLRPDDDEWVRAALTAAFGSVLVVRRGELLDASSYPGFLAVSGDDRAGLVVVVVRGVEYEVLVLASAVEGRGVGQALMRHCFEDARRHGCRRVWLTTTNDNVRAFAFYQRLGMTLCAVHLDAIAEARRLKPSLPERGSSGIRMDHELELELRLD